MNTHSSARPMIESATMSRRPPRVRSSAGPSNGQITANGAIEIKRYSNSFSRELCAGDAKKSEPASDTATHASPHALIACVQSRRAKGLGGAKRGSVGRGGTAVIRRRTYSRPATMLRRSPVVHLRGTPGAAVGARRYHEHNAPRLHGQHAVLESRAVVARLQR